MHDERIEKLEIYDHRARGESSSTLSRGIRMRKVCSAKNRSDCGNFYFKSSLHHFYFFSTVKPQLACHWSVGKYFPSNRMLRTRGSRKLLSRNGSHFVARFVRLRCYFWHFSDVFRFFRCELCKIMQFSTFFVAVTVFRTTNQTTTAGRTPFVTTCRSIRTSAKATRPKLVPAICGRFRVVSLRRTSWHGNTLVFL